MKNYLLLGILLLSFSINPAISETQSEETKQEKITLKTPPKVIGTAEVNFPADTEFPSENFQVILKIQIDKEGKILNLSVAKGINENIDKAALDAVKQFKFTPAILSNDQSFGVTFNFPLNMKKPKVAEKPKEKEKFIFKAKILQRGTRKPLSDAIAVAKNKEGERFTETTNKKGEIEFELPVGKWDLTVAPTGHEKLNINLESDTKQKIEKLFYLESLGGEFQTIIKTKGEDKSVTIRKISRNQVLKSAGTAGDAIKIISNLPGVARRDFGGAGLILRGAEPGDSRTFLEGQRINALSHFGGIRSTFNSAFLEEINFYPGNFRSEFGRSTGGVVDVKVRDPADDMFRGQIDVNLYDAGFALEGPISEKWSLGGSFHRSYIDTLLPLFLPDDAPLSFDTLPRFYDYQFIATYKPDNKSKFRTIYYGSLDKLIASFKDPAGDPKIRGDLDTKIMFHNIQADYISKLDKNWSYKAKLYTGLSEASVLIGQDFYFDLDTIASGTRSELIYKESDNLKFRLGADIKFIDVTIALSLPDRPKEGENRVPISVRNVNKVEEDSYSFEPGFYVDMEYQLTKNLLVIPGFRYDYYSEITTNTNDPRLNLEYSIDPSFKFKAGVGRYQKPPEYDESDENNGNPKLRAERSHQVSFGFEKIFELGFSIDMTGFYKKLDRLVVRNINAYNDPTEKKFTNRGEGRIYGLELLSKYNFPFLKIDGWLSYTYQRSFRTERPGEEEERLFDFDQPHILTTILNYNIGSGWSTGARFRLVSGNPTTPITGSVYDATTDTYVPLYGENNSTRNRAFNQLDVRIDKVWTYDTWKLNLFLDVQNVYLAENQEGTRYNYDYTQSDVQTGVPILTILGITANW